MPRQSPIPPIRIISLVRATERREHVGAAFAALGLPIEIVDAVDGNALTDEQVGRYSQWRACFEIGRGLRQGELGAALSHLMVYERMVREETPAVAVFEDDVEPGPDLRALLESVDGFPPDWEVVTLFSTFAWSDPQPVDAPPVAGAYRLCTYRRQAFGTVGYVISLAGARRLLAVAYPIGLPSDGLLLRPRPAGLVRYGIEPSPLTHRAIASEVILRGDPVIPDRMARRPVDWLVITAGKVRRRLPLARQRRPESSSASR